MVTVAHWKVATQCGEPASCMALSPETGLLAEGDGMKAVVWQSQGDHAGLTLQPITARNVLPAGWYRLEGRVERIDGVITLPGLRLVQYVEGRREEHEIALPEPDTTGRIRMLVLFKYPVISLTFCPGVWEARFRLGEFRLLRVSRARALRDMLLRGRGGGLRRGVAFARDVGTQGLVAATENAFVDYRNSWRPAGLDEYAIWIRKYDTFTASRLHDLHERMRCLGGAAIEPDLLLPLDRTRLRTVQQCIEGVRGQMWTRWKLYVVTTAGCEDDVRCWLREMASQEPRIRLAQVETSSLATAFNKALEMADGGHVAVLSATDRLRRHALLEIVEALAKDPFARFVYADDDRMDDKGLRSHPRFKPDWNADLLNSCNYIGRFAVIRANDVRRAGGLRDGFDDPFHDLFLRCTETLSRACIRHLPCLLHHRGADEPGDHGMKSNGASAVAEHLARTGTVASVQAMADGRLHVRWPLPVTQPKVDVIIPTRDGLGLLRTCVESIQTRTTWTNYEIVIIDNRSRNQATLDYLQHIECHERVRVIRDDGPFNYAAINNRAVAQCDGELVCLLNNDIEVISDHWLEEMAGHALRPDVGAVGAMLYYPDDTIQHAGVIVGLNGVADHIYAGQPRGYPGREGRALVAQELSAVTAACLLVRRGRYLEVGGLDEALAVDFNDVDFCLRLRQAGYRNIWTSFAELYHHESATRGRDTGHASRTHNAREVHIMRTRWAALLNADPAWNPNLSLTGFNPGLAFPPRTTPETGVAPVGTDGMRPAMGSDRD